MIVLLSNWWDFLKTWTTPLFICGCFSPFNTLKKSRTWRVKKWPWFIPSTRRKFRKQLPLKKTLKKKKELRVLEPTKKAKKWNEKPPQRGYQEPGKTTWFRYLLEKNKPSSLDLFFAHSAVSFLLLKNFFSQNSFF